MSKEFNGIQRPAVYRHANPDLAFLDSNNVAGGFRTKLDTLQELYNDGTPRPAIPEASIGKFKDHSTLVYVEETQKYYVLVDYDNSHNANGWEVFVGDVEDTDVTYDHVYMWTGTTATPNPLLLNEWYDNTQSAGRLTGGVITDNGNGTVAVGAGSGIIKIEDTGEEFDPDPNFNTDRNAINKYVEWEAIPTLTFGNDGYNYIFYNADADEIQASTDESFIQNNTNFNIGRVFKDGNNITIRECGQNLWNLNRRLHKVGDEVFGVQRAEGLITTSPSGRFIDVSAGILWAELLNRFSTTGFTSTSQSFTEWYIEDEDPTIWNSEPLQEISDDWNDGLTKETLTTGYTVHWVYVVHDSSVHVVLHDEAFTGITEARLATPRAELPPLVEGYATLSARIIQEAGASTITEIGSAFDVVFATTTPVQHNDLGSIQGGIAGQRFHLTSDELSDVQDIPDMKEITDVALTGATNGLNTDNDPRVVELGGDLTDNTTIGGVGGNHSLTINEIAQLTLSAEGGASVVMNSEIVITAPTTGAQYAADYSAGFVNRSLVDKEYVDTEIGNIDTGLMDAENGLTEDNGTVKLGGALTESTTIEIVSGTSLFITDSRTDTRGIKYSGDYSTFYTERSLVDKGYVDSIASGLVPVNAVDVATTSGITLSGLTEIDGIFLTGGERVLVKDQSIASQNGIYVATGDTWQRAEDYDGTPEGEVQQGNIIPVLNGDTQGNQLWVLVTPNPIVIDTTDLTFARFSKPIDILAGEGIDITQAGGQKTINVDDSIAGNGLTWDSGVIDLGGDLTENTTINGQAGTHAFTFSNLNSFTLGLDAATNISLTSGNGMVFTEVGGQGGGSGVKYAADYSADYGARSLVDAGYVTGLTDGLQTQINNIDVGLTGATNGLSVDGQDVKLGGDLTENTTINGQNGNFQFNVCNIDIFNMRVPGTVSTQGGFIFMDTCFTSIGVTNNAVTGGSFIEMDMSNNMFFSTYHAPTFAGAQYGSDHSANFVARSLPDVAYVTGLTDALQTEINNIDVGLTGATNGLSVDGQNVELGGTLTKETTIDGTLNAWDLNINVAGFNVYTTCGFYISGATDNDHARYQGDYSSAFDVRSIPDVGYVTGKTSALQEQIDEIDVGLTGSTNGLTDDGTTVKLGGALTENTTIGQSGETNDLTIFANDLLVGTFLGGNVTILGDGDISITGGVNLNLGSNNADINITTANAINIVNEPPQITTEDFSVLVRDDSSGEVKVVDGSELGEDNNNYFITTASTSITATTAMYVILLDTDTEDIEVTLPASPVNGQAYKIKDATGNALTRNVKIDGNGKDIDGGDSATINTDYGALEVVYNSGFDAWFTLAFIN